MKIKINNEKFIIENERVVSTILPAYDDRTCIPKLNLLEVATETDLDRPLC